MERKGSLNKLFIIIIAAFIIIITFLFHILQKNGNVSFRQIIGANSDIENQAVSEKWDFNDLTAYAEAANYYFINDEDGNLQGCASVLSIMSEEPIKEQGDAFVYRITTDDPYYPDFMLRIEYERDKSKGMLYAKCAHWEDKGCSRNVKIREKSRHISKKEIEEFEKALSQDKFWESESCTFGSDGTKIILEGDDGNRYKVMHYFSGNGIENVHKTLFDMEKRWIINEFSTDKNVTKDQVKFVREKFWPLYGRAALNN